MMHIHFHFRYFGKYLHHTSDIFFAYFSQATIRGKFQHGSKIPIDGHPNGGIRIFIGEREPHQALIGEDEGTPIPIN